MSEADILKRILYTAKVRARAVDKHIDMLGLKILCLVYFKGFKSYEQVL